MPHLTDLTVCSRMRLSLARLGAEFGHLATVRGILTFKLSPFEQRAFGGAISHGIPNTIRRIRAKLFIVAPRKSSYLAILGQTFK